MPTPVGHSLAGLAIHLAGRHHAARKPWLTAAALIALANLPDLDLLPGYLVGEPRAFHWGPTHSLSAAIVVGMTTGLVARRLTGRFLPFGLLGGAAYASHLLLDLLLGPGAVSQGLQVLWPVSTERFIAPWAVFSMLPSSEEAGPVRMLFSRAVLPILLRELAIMLPVCAAAWLYGRRTRTPLPHPARHRRSRIDRRDAASCEG